MQECNDCAEVEMWLEELQQEYGSIISIRHVDILEKEGWDEFKGHGFSITPAVVINEEITLQFIDITKERLSELVEEIPS
ncbi:MAG: hypothetical protein HXS48_03510 [Theionarchaea archaeon]|nr:MAG: hypothetical protein AYK19_16175 [Theionarchaea archaeon DG-70-1]MBU7025985.1 hypothetical protein [Theionarchaea archaeon]